MWVTPIERTKASRVRNLKPDEWVVLYLEIGCQTDDGEVTEFVPLGWGQLWERGCPLWKNNIPQTDKEKKQTAREQQKRDTSLQGHTLTNTGVQALSRQKLLQPAEFHKGIQWKIIWVCVCACGCGCFKKRVLTVFPLCSILQFKKHYESEYGMCWHNKICISLFHFARLLWSLVTKCVAKEWQVLYIFGYFKGYSGFHLSVWWQCNHLQPIRMSNKTSEKSVPGWVPMSSPSS